MRKVILLIAVFSITVFLNSCTDTSENLVDNNQTYEKTFLIDKDDIEEPEDRQD